MHRDARDTWDESADLHALARTDVTVVCAGVKSILDVRRTLERLETLGVTVLGYGTDAFPGFYLTDSGHPVDWRVDSPDEVADVMLARAALGTDDRGVVVANPLPPDEQVDPALHDRLLARRSRGAPRPAGVRGKDVTPFLLEFFHRESEGVTPGGEHPHHPAQRRAGGADRRGCRRWCGSRGQPVTPVPGPRGTETLDVVVVGDVMVDVVAAMSGPLARGSDTPSTVTTAGGGSGANVAVWLARQGVPTTYVGRVGDDALGRESVTALTDGGVTACGQRRRRPRHRHLRRPRGARR